MEPTLTHLGKYELLEKIGQGGMASVYLARGAGPAGFCRLFAVKTIHEQLVGERDFVQMFLDEARLAGRIHHPNAVPVYEVGTDLGRHFIAMDYVHGETLAATLDQTWSRGSPLPLPLAIFILEGICEALHAAHELPNKSGGPLGVVHRDVSPHNILIGYDGIARITDFGVAKAADRLTHTRTGYQKGKLAYMAPEQLHGEAIDRRVDVFALGIILWESLTGARLFKRAGQSETIRAIRDLNVPPLSSFRSDVPPVFEDIIRRTLAAQPDERYGTAREMAHQLRAAAVAHGLHAASSDLEHHMQSVFPAELARRKSAMHEALNRPPTPSRTADQPADRRASRTSTPTPSWPSERRGLHGAWLIAACAVVVVLSATLTAKLRAQYRNGPKSAAPATVLVPSPAIPPPTPKVTVKHPEPLKAAMTPPVDDDVAVAVKTVPSHASISFRGERVESPLRWPRSTTRFSITVSARGYRSRTIHIHPTEDQVIEVVLLRQRRQKPSPHQAKKKTPRKQKALRKPKAPLLVTGDDL